MWNRLERIYVCRIVYHKQWIRGSVACSRDGEGQWQPLLFFFFFILNTSLSMHACWMWIFLFSQKAEANIILRVIVLVIYTYGLYIYINYGNVFMSSSAVRASRVCVRVCVWCGRARAHFSSRVTCIWPCDYSSSWTTQCTKAVVKGQ